MSVYVIAICDPSEIAGELTHFKVESRDFIQVEEWAFAKAQEIKGDVWSIEKMYFFGAEEMFGSTDAFLGMKERVS